MKTPSHISTLFIAYAIQDQPILEELRKQLHILERKKEITIQYDGKIEPGKVWATEIDKAIANAQIILLLVSPDFIFSDECYENQLQKALKKHKKGTATVIPIIVRPCLWEETAFGHIKALPLAAVPVTSPMWERDGNGRDEPYMKVAAAISKQVKSFQAAHEKNAKKKAKKAKNKTSKEKQQPQSKRKRGRILYDIPTKMQKETTYNCIIRIAPEDLPEEILKEYLDNADQAKVESLRRIGKHMRVQLIDSGNAFIIKTQSTAEQVIEDDDYTEWRYEVTPFLSGTRRLQLKVAITLVRDEHGKEYKDVVVLDRNIEVVTEEVETTAEWAMVKDDNPKNMIVVHSKIEDNEEPPPANQAKIRALPFLRKYSRALSMFLLFIMILPTATWAAAPEMVVPIYLDTIHGAENWEKLSEDRIALKDKKTGKWGLINQHGIQSTRPIYDHIKKDESGIIQIQKGNKWGALQAEDISDKKGLDQVWNNVFNPTDIEVVPTVSETPPIKIENTNQVQVTLNGRKDTLPQIPAKQIKQDVLQKAILQLPKTEQQGLQEVQDLLKQGDIAAIKKAETKLAALETIDNREVETILQQQKVIALQKRTVKLYEVAKEIAEETDVEKQEEKQDELKRLKEGTEVETVTTSASTPKTPPQTYTSSQTTDEVVTEETDVEEAENEAKTETVVEKEEESKETENSTLNVEEKPEETSPKRNDTPATSNTQTAEEKENPLSNEKISEDNPEITSEKTTPNPFKDLPNPINQILQNMVIVQGGTFQMGCTSEQKSDCYDNEKPVHTVTVSTFKIAKYEVTQAQWQAVMGDNPSFRSLGCDNCPVEGVTWNDVQDFIKQLNDKTGRKFRLPTEAEWEFAARGGNKNDEGYKYAGSDNLDDVAWYGFEKTNKKTHIVGEKEPNELGLHDMSGNVWEWVEDCWNYDYDGAPKDGKAWTTGNCDKHVLRGGSWNERSTSKCRVSVRDMGGLPSVGYASNGFRLVEDF